MKNLLITASTLLVCFAAYGQSRAEVKWLTDTKGKKITKATEKLWNKQGDIVRSVEYIKGSTPLIMMFSFEYKSEHKVKRTDLHTCEYTIYVYDKAGRLIQELLYTKTHQLREKKNFNYAGDSKTASNANVYEPGKPLPILHYDFEYYPDGLLKKEVQTAGGSWFMTRDFKYDSHKHLIYEGNEADGGVGLVRYYYYYNGDILTKDIVKVPDTSTEYHLYETHLK